MPYLKSEYTFKKFERSKNKSKKYDAILVNKKTGREKRMAFGSANMQQYRDRTGLGLYKSKDHLDKTRRKAFLDRFRGTRERQNWKKEYTPLMFSTRFLW